MANPIFLSHGSIDVDNRAAPVTDRFPGVNRSTPRQQQRKTAFDSIGNYCAIFDPSGLIELWDMRSFPIMLHAVNLTCLSGSTRISMAWDISSRKLYVAADSIVSSEVATIQSQVFIIDVKSNHADFLCRFPFALNSIAAWECCGSKLILKADDFTCSFVLDITDRCFSPLVVTQCSEEQYIVELDSGLQVLSELYFLDRICLKAADSVGPADIAPSDSSVDRVTELQKPAAPDDAAVLRRWEVYLDGYRSSRGGSSQADEHQLIVADMPLQSFDNGSALISAAFDSDIIPAQDARQDRLYILYRSRTLSKLSYPLYRSKSDKVNLDVISTLQLDSASFGPMKTVSVSTSGWPNDRQMQQKDTMIVLCSDSHVLCVDAASLSLTMSLSLDTVVAVDRSCVTSDTTTGSENDDDNDDDDDIRGAIIHAAALIPPPSDGIITFTRRDETKAHSQRIDGRTDLQMAILLGRRRDIGDSYAIAILAQEAMGVAETADSISETYPSGNHSSSSSSRSRWRIVQRIRVPDEDDHGKPKRKFNHIDPQQQLPADSISRLFVAGSGRALYADISGRGLVVAPTAIRFETNFSGAMYPPGFLLLKRVVPYIEREEELDLQVLNAAGSSGTEGAETAMSATVEASPVAAAARTGAGIVSVSVGRKSTGAAEGSVGSDEDCVSDLDIGTFRPSGESSLASDRLPFTLFGEAKRLLTASQQRYDAIGRQADRGGGGGFLGIGVGGGRGRGRGRRGGRGRGRNRLDHNRDDGTTAVGHTAVENDSIHSSCGAAHAHGSEEGHAMLPLPSICTTDSEGKDAADDTLEQHAASCNNDDDEEHDLSDDDADVHAYDGEGEAGTETGAGAGAETGIAAGTESSSSSSEVVGQSQSRPPPTAASFADFFSVPRRVVTGDFDARMNRELHLGEESAAARRNPQLLEERYRTMQRESAESVRRVQERKHRLRQKYKRDKVVKKLAQLSDEAASIRRFAAFQTQQATPDDRDDDGDSAATQAAVMTND